MLRVSRRRVIAGSAALLCAPRYSWPGQASGAHFNVGSFDRDRILRLADAARAAGLLTLTSVPAPGASDPHRFFCDAVLSMSTDEVSGFTGHTDLLESMVDRVAALVAAWRVTTETTYLEAARAQLRAWCLAPATRMVPTLENETAAADKDIDLRPNAVRFTLPLAELARAVSFVCAPGAIDPDEAEALRDWFVELLRWFTESERGGIARDSTRADAIFWTMQASEIARFTRNDPALLDCNHRFRDKLLRQLHLDGYFAYALSTNRPYAESMLLLECVGSAAESLSTPFESTWNYALPDGRGMHAAISWALPFLQSRGKWDYPADLRNFNKQPFRENALLFAARAWNRPDYTDVWVRMKPADDVDAELRREHPITQPALWTVRPPA